MRISERYKKLLEEEDGMNQSTFCSEIGYSERSLSHFLNKRTEFPRMDLVMKTMKSRPKWNWRWIFFGEGEKYFKDENIIVVNEPEPGYQGAQSIIKSLTDQLDYMRTENTRLRGQLTEREKV